MQTQDQIRTLIDGLRRDLVGAGLGSDSSESRPAPDQDCPTCQGSHNTDVHLAAARGLQVGDEITVVNDAGEFQAHVLEVDRGMVYFWAMSDASLMGLWYGVEPARNCYR